MYPQQRNSNFRARAPPAGRPGQRPYQRSGGATPRYKTPSPARTPKHPDNYCYLCVRDRRPDASSHFLRQCPQLPQRERDIWTRIFDKALQSRSQPRESWPKKILGQTVSVRLMNMVEDFYNLDQVPDAEYPREDFFAEEEESALTTDYMSLQEESSNDPDISIKSVKIKCSRIDCNCGCTCKDDTTGAANRRVNVSPSPAFPVEITNNKTGASKWMT